MTDTKLIAREPTGDMIEAALKAYSPRTDWYQRVKAMLIAAHDAAPDLMKKFEDPPACPHGVMAGYCEPCVEEMNRDNNSASDDRGRGGAMSEDTKALCGRLRGALQRPCDGIDAVDAIERLERALAIAEAREREAYERAAKVCDKAYDEALGWLKDHPRAHEFGEAMAYGVCEGAHDCAIAIRALAKERT